MMQPLVLLANLAAEAQGLYLGTALYLLPLHHPVAVAEQTATMDIIAGGKFLFGVGQGYWASTAEIPNDVSIVIDVYAIGQ